MNLPRTPLALLLTLPLLTVPVACSSSNTEDSGPPLTAQQYFNFIPGQCFAYTSGDAGTPTRGLLIWDAGNPVGEITVRVLKRGQIEEIEYLTFDGGEVFLNQRDVYGDTGIDSRLYSSPLGYLVAPLTSNQQNLITSSDYTGTSIGSVIFTSGLNGMPFTWNGIGADAGGSSAYPLQFSEQPDGGGGITENRTLLPTVGFVQLYAPDDSNQYTTFTLVSISGVDAGTICGD
jgi:hypothetical protein